MSEKYDLIFSMGSTALTSDLLKNKGLQIFDFPYDRVSGGSFLSRMSLFLLDFAGFIEPQNIIEKKDTPRVGVTEYQDVKTGFVYPYDFNPNIPFENSLPDVKSRYNKYIKNLKTCIKASKTILIIYIEHPQIKEDDTEISELLIEASNKLKIKYPHKKIDILYAKNINDTDDVNITEFGKNARKVEFNFCRKFSEMSALEIDINALSLIVSNIQLKTNWRMKKIIYYQKVISKLNSFIYKPR